MNSFLTNTLALALVALLPGAGEIIASSLDTGTSEVGAVDTGTLDTGALDTGAPETKTLEAKTRDAGTVVDSTGDVRLIDFHLEDQFGRSYSREDFRGRYLAILAADSGGSPFTSAWGAEIGAAVGRQGMEESLAIVGLSDLRSVPSFLRSRIRKSFPTNPKAWVLMDWKGVFAQTYSFERRHCNLLLFAADGRLLFQAAGREVDARTIAEFESALTRAE